MHMRFKKSSVESGLIVHTMTGVSSTMSRRLSSSRNARSVRCVAGWTSRPAIASPRIARPPKRVRTVKVIGQRSPRAGEAAGWNRWQFAVQRNGRARSSDSAIFRQKVLIPKAGARWALALSRNTVTFATVFSHRARPSCARSASVGTHEGHRSQAIVFLPELADQLHSQLELLRADLRDFCFDPGGVFLPFDAAIVDGPPTRKPIRLAARIHHERAVRGEMRSVPAPLMDPSTTRLSNEGRRSHGRGRAGLLIGGGTAASGREYARDEAA